MDIDRRDFLRGAVAVGALGAANALAGCAAPKPRGDAESQASDDAKIVADKTVSTDVVIIGAGMSGLAAAVQAGIAGDSVVLLESTSTVGGSGFGVEGIFGWNTAMQQELGIEFDKNLVLRSELESANYGADGALWESMVDDSAANIEWLIDQGVTFSGRVDAYEVRGTSGIVPSMHWFEEGIAKVGYVPAMQARCKELGVEIFTDMRATTLSVGGTAIDGVFAESSEGITKFEARAVIIASGSWQSDKNMLVKHGFDPDFTINMNVSDQDGSGLKMALEVGAKEFNRPCVEGVTGLPELSFDRDVLVQALGLGNTCVWVNRDGRRFTNEDSCSVNFELPVTTVLNQREAYTLFTRSIAETALEEFGADTSELDAWIERSPEGVWTADSIAALAEAAGMDGDALQFTVDQYNEFCRQKSDASFGKDPALLVEIAAGPFYLARISIAVDTVIGGITTDKDARVLNAEWEAIPGLYAVGVSGCMLYRDVYPIDVCATACQNSINSGRKAALHAHNYIATLA